MNRYCNNLSEIDKKNTDAKNKTDKGDKKSAGKKNSKIEPLIAAFKLALGEKVKDVRASERLTDSPVCLVADEGDMDMNIERLLKQHNQLSESTPRVLEINPSHALIKKLSEKAKISEGIDVNVEEAAFLLLDQARIVEGEAISDPLAFSRRMATVLERGLTT